MSTLRHPPPLTTGVLHSQYNDIIPSEDALRAAARGATTTTPSIPPPNSTRGALSEIGTEAANGAHILESVRPSEESTASVGLPHDMCADDYFSVEKELDAPSYHRMRSVQQGSEGWTMIDDMMGDSAWHPFKGGGMANGARSGSGCPEALPLDHPKLLHGEILHGHIACTTLVTACDPFPNQHLKKDFAPASIDICLGSIVFTSYRMMFITTEDNKQPNVIYECPLGAIVQLSVRPIGEGRLRRHRKVVKARRKMTPHVHESFLLDVFERNSGFVVFGLWGVDANFVAHQIALVTMPQSPLALSITAKEAAEYPRPCSARTRLLHAYQRMGVVVPSNLLHGEEEIPQPPCESTSKFQWRISEVNTGFKVCSSYPELVAVPFDASEATLLESASFRGGNRFPVLSYRDKQTGASISRCGQPMLGVFMLRNEHDEALLTLTHRTAKEGEKEGQFFIMDLRSQAAAIGNFARGGGHESRNYKDSLGCPAAVNFCNIENIHAMRESLWRLQLEVRSLHDRALQLVGDSLTEGDPPDPLKDTDGTPPDTPDDEATASSFTMGMDTVFKSVQKRAKVMMGGESRAKRKGTNGGQLLETAGIDDAAESTWLLHIESILIASLNVVRVVSEWKQSVVVHCTDGWDRTPQVTSLAQLLLDPHSRTYEGFTTLIDKDWVSMGHPFATRCSGLRLCSPIEVVNSFSGCGGEQSGGNDGHICGPQGPKPGPIFTQWLACVAHILEQHPMAFEFTPDLLWILADEHCSGRHGSFLGDNERDRVHIGVYKRNTPCPWTLFKARHGEKLVNPTYDATYCEGALKVEHSKRCLNAWVASLTGRSSNSVLQKHRELVQEKEALAETVRVQAEMVRVQQHELEKLQSKVKILESRYTEDVGHRPVMVRESHPGGRNARLQPILEKDGGVSCVRGEEDTLDDEDASLVLVSHLYQTPVCFQGSFIGEF